MRGKYVTFKTNSAPRIRPNISITQPFQSDSYVVALRPVESRNRHRPPFVSLVFESAPHGKAFSKRQISTGDYNNKCNLPRQFVCEKKYCLEVLCTNLRNVLLFLSDGRRMGRRLLGKLNSFRFVPFPGEIMLVSRESRLCRRRFPCRQKVVRL